MAGNGDYTGCTGRCRGGTDDLANALYLTNRGLVRNFPRLGLFLHRLVDMGWRGIRHLHCAATDQRAATSAGTKFR